MPSETDVNIVVGPRGTAGPPRSSENSVTPAMGRETLAIWEIRGVFYLIADGGLQGGLRMKHLGGFSLCGNVGTAFCATPAMTGCHQAKNAPAIPCEHRFAHRGGHSDARQGPCERHPSCSCSNHSSAIHVAFEVWNRAKNSAQKIASRLT